MLGASLAVLDGWAAEPFLFNWTRKEQSYSLKTPDVESSGRIPARSWKVVVF